MSKVMISIPQEFLEEIDTLAKKEHRTRSELIRESLREYFVTHGGFSSAAKNLERKKAIQYIRKNAYKWKGEKEASQIIREMRDKRIIK
ncbi:MAG: ribbon-helix-helix protein, CopG family [Caldiserica bacterium]|nr:ribbon-helix-helix protein, CopG family [Caldisericota bacterium]